MRQATLIIIAPFALGTLPDVAREGKRSALRELSALLDRARHATAQPTVLPTVQPAGVEGAPPPASSVPERIVDELRLLLAGSSERAESIHYLSFLLIDDEGQKRPAYVVLEMNCDGSARAAREELARRAPQFLARLFDGCEGFEPARPSGFLRRHTRRAETRYVAFPGKSVGDIRTQAELRSELRSRFEAQRPGQLPAELPSDPWLRAASRRRATRLSPTSASSIWRRLSLEPPAQGERPPHRPPPLSVRWSLHGDVWREQLALWSRRLFVPAVVCGAGAGFHALAEAPEPGQSRALLGAALACAVARSLLGLWVALRETPRALRMAAAWRVALTFGWDWLVAMLYIAAALGLVLAASSIASRSASAPVLAVTLALAAAGVGFARARLPLVVPCVVGFGLAVGAWSPPVSLAPLALLAAAPFALVLALVAFVMSGARGLCSALAIVLGCVVTAALGQSGVLPGVAVWVGLGALSLAALASLGWVARWLAAVRRSEVADASDVTEADLRRPGEVRWDTAHLDRVQRREDELFQNHLAVVTPLKAGALRLRTLQRVLRAVNLLARVYYNRGDLGGIRTIHFASFLILPDNERLLLLTNYDGGFGSYLHEFNGVSGVTAVWSNCVGFPSSFFLVGDGAGDEQRFKAFARRNQATTSGWYSAYPGLSIGDIEAAASTHRDLGRPIEDRATWLGRQQARFARPLSEAECDLALRRL